MQLYIYICTLYYQMEITYMLKQSITVGDHIHAKTITDFKL